MGSGRNLVCGWRFLVALSRRGGSARWLAVPLHQSSLYFQKSVDAYINGMEGGRAGERPNGNLLTLR